MTSIYTQDKPLETVAGLMVKKCPSTGIWSAVTHHSRAAVKSKSLDDKGWHYHTTVGGGVEPGETLQEAMVRELVEEYGESTKACDVTPITSLRPTTIRSGNSKVWKRYNWFFIRCPWGLNLSPNQNEVYGDVVWHPSTVLEPYSSPMLLPFEKRQMFWKAVEASRRQHPDMFDM